MKNRSHMLESIIEMKKSHSGQQKIGAILVKDDKIIGRGHKTNACHAERMAIDNAKENGYNPKGATMYATLEPCVDVGKGKTKPCTELIIEEKINCVVIGSYDPNSRIRRKGWKALNDAGIKLFDYDKDLHNQVVEINNNATTVFKEGYGPTHGARFDYKLNGGRFIIRQTKDSNKQIVTRWTLKGMNGIYAYARHGVKVAKADYANSYDDIDKVHQFDFESHSVAVNVGEICIFMNEEMVVLVKVLEVKSGERYGANERAFKELCVFGINQRL